jgi:hypothetical protein
MSKSSPFHQGELDVQQRTGELKIAARVGQCIQDSLPVAATHFLHQQSSLWIGLEDNEGFLQSFPLFGDRGFVTSRDGKQLTVTLDDRFSLPNQWLNSLKPDKAIGCTAIDLAGRSRVRINGVINAISDNSLVVDIVQAYPNCPKYIRRRAIQGEPKTCSYQHTSKGNKASLSDMAIDIIKRSDTAFVASLGPNGADASHRGGASGFIQYSCDNGDSDKKEKILMPDYIGNGMYNTLGNFMINPVGGIIICDFEQGYFLQLSGKVNILFDKDIKELKSGGTNRFWELEIQKWDLFQIEGDIQWESFDFSKFNP